MVDRHIERIARGMTDDRRTVEGLVRTQQVLRTIVNDRPVADTLADQQEVADTVSDQADTIDMLDTGTGVEEFDQAQDASDAAHDAFMDAVAASGAAADAAEGVSTALTKAESALDEAALASTKADGKNSRRASVTEPDPPEGGWVQGDQWVVLDAGTGRPRELLVWDGAQFVSEQVLADELLVLGDDGVIRLADGLVTAPAIATDALDSKVIRTPKLYGGYIEAPTIASSDALGNGANMLNDPDFSGAVNGDWVLSGHAGDAAVTQRDTITWDQTWSQKSTPSTFANRSVGSVVADMTLAPIERLTGSMVLANFAWFNSAPRFSSNPHVYSDGDSLPQPREDRSFRAAPGAPAIKPYVEKTTFLTNSAVVAVASGEQWAITLETTKSGYGSVGGLKYASIQIIHALTGSLIHEQQISDEQLRAGRIEATWAPAISGDVKLRIKATYRCGGAAASSARVTSSASYVRHIATGSSVTTEWNGGGWDKYLRYSSTPDYMPHTPSAVTGGAGADATWTLLGAMFGTRKPDAGWRLSAEGGLELFNEVGARTGKIDGVGNFLAGRLATADTGNRVELKDRDIGWYEGADTLWAYIKYASDRRMRLNAGYIYLDGIVEFRDDTEWTDIRIRPGFSAQSPDEVPQVRVKGGALFLRGLFSNQGLSASGSFTVGDFPTQPINFAPPRNMQVPAGTNSGTATGQMFLAAAGTIQIRTGATLSAYYGFGAGSWPK